MLIYTVLLAVVGASLAITHEDFPGWKKVRLVQLYDKEVTSLPCFDAIYYPFYQTGLGIKTKWILPKSSSSAHLENGQTQSGWSVKNNDLTITKSGLNEPDAARGQYVCARLALVHNKPQDVTDPVYSWYYLRWGVGLYSDVPAMTGDP